MDAIGTHLVENAIGIARSTSFDPRFSRILATYAAAELRKEIASKCGLRLYIHNRINAGGCKTNNTYESIDLPEDWRVEWIMQMFLGSCDPDFTSHFEQERSAFLEQLNFIAHYTKTKYINNSEVANSQILARLIAFGSKHKIDTNDLI